MSAVLSSSRTAAPYLLAAILKQRTPPANLATRIAAMIGAQGNDEAIAQTLKLLGTIPAESELLMAILDGLGQGMQNSSRPLSALWDAPPSALREPIAQAMTVFQNAATTAKEEAKSIPQRLAAIRLLTSGPSKLALPALSELLGAQHPLEVQTAAVRALASRNEADVTPVLLGAWKQTGPLLRRELLEAVFGRRDRIGKLLDALESKKIAAAQIEPARISFLKTHSDAEIRRRALALFAGLGESDRKKAVDSYRDTLALKSDIARGKTLFSRNCAACHRLENVGSEVGANLQAALRTKSKEALLIDSSSTRAARSIRATINYRVTTQSGRTLTGILGRGERRRASPCAGRTKPRTPCCETRSTQLKRRPNR